MGIAPKLRGDSHLDHFLEVHLLGVNDRFVTASLQTELVELG